MSVSFKNLMAGDPAPFFRQRSYANPDYCFDTVAGRYIVLCFYASATDEHTQAALKAVRERGDLFDDDFASFFGVSFDRGDDTEKRVADTYPGYRFIFDFDGRVGRDYGAISIASDQSEDKVAVRRIWVIIDPTLRVTKVIPFAKDRQDITEALAFLDQQPPPSRFAGVELQAPIIMLPNIFEPEFCERLIALYDADGGKDSGFMREVNGKTVETKDYNHKRRRDYLIQDREVADHAAERIFRRIVPEIQKIHQHRITRIERRMVACYSAEEQGHFRPHRDNTTKGTAHRRFAVSINLNSDFEGGDICFPEYGPRTFRPPPGGAVVFSCSLLHTVVPVTKGRRYAFLPFLYDEEGAKLREQNNAFLGDNVAKYNEGKAEKA